MNKPGRAYIGTSGWHYLHWKELFYPKDIPPRGFLEFYARYFESAEINNTFYRLPEKETLLAWKKTVPRNFTFSVKASRYITHTKKLNDPKKTVPLFLKRTEELGEKLGVIIFQLPPHWQRDLERLIGLLKTLPRQHRYAFEFRDPSWFKPDVLRALEDHRAAFCIYELNGTLSPKAVTSDYVYIRLHGPKAAYQGRYSPAALRLWSQEIQAWNQQGKDVFCYFDNDERAYAVKNAQALKNLLSQKGAQS
ncbi:MAG: DUF72 domain-containing protein [Candidatus Omnitrophota bacterium]